MKTRIEVMAVTSLGTNAKADAMSEERSGDYPGEARSRGVSRKLVRYLPLLVPGFAVVLAIMVYAIFFFDFAPV